MRRFSRYLIDSRTDVSQSAELEVTCMTDVVDMFVKWEVWVEGNRNSISPSWVMNSKKKQWTQDGSLWYAGIWAECTWQGVTDCEKAWASLEIRLRSSEGRFLDDERVLEPSHKYLVIDGVTGCQQVEGNQRHSRTRRHQTSYLRSLIGLSQ